MITVIKIKPNFMFSEKNFLWKTIKKHIDSISIIKIGNFELFYNVIYNEFISPKYLHEIFLSSIYLDKSCYFPENAKTSTEALLMFIYWHQDQNLDEFLPSIRL